MLVRLNRDSEAELFLRQAVKFDAQSNLALRLLADVRLRAGDAKEAVDLARRAANDKEAPISTWLLLALAERASNDSNLSLTFDLTGEKHFVSLTSLRACNGVDGIP